MQWRNGCAILKKVCDLRECCSQLRQHQKELRVLVDREMALLAGSLQGSGLPVGDEGQEARSDDIISVVHSAVDTLTADYFVLPTLPFLLFTYSSADAGMEAFVRGRHLLCKVWP